MSESNLKNTLSKTLSTYMSEKDVMRMFSIIEDKFKDSKTEVVYDILLFLKHGKTVEEVVKLLDEGKMGWNHPKFGDIVDAQNEIFSYIECPYDVVEGMFSCPKCNGKRTVSYSKQTRSADEGMTTFVFCASKECRHQWSYRG
jgi:DNA-directed RNA polymerase subunit M/transcription elongation factor TFIIS